MSKLIMSWSKVKLEIGKTGANDAMATELFEPGVIKDKSTTLSAEDGDTLEAKATGGVVVASESNEPVLTLETTVMEQDFAVREKFGGATVNQDGELVVSSNLVDDDYSFVLTPKNVGATGIKVRKASVSLKPAYSEEEGHSTVLTFKILQCEDNELYRKFKVAASAPSAQGD